MYQGTYQPPTQFAVFPPVIKNLLILNGLLFLAQLVPDTNSMLIYWFGLWPIGDAPIPLGQFLPAVDQLFLLTREFFSLTVKYVRPVDVWRPG